MISFWLFDSAAEAILIVEGAGIIEEANGAAGILFGLLREFHFDRRLKESSPFAQSLEEKNGLFVMETDLIEISHRFTRNAVSRFPTYIELGFNQQYGNTLQSAYAYLDQDTGKESEWTEEAEEMMA